MLTIQVLNDGTGTNESANYEYRVHVNGDLVRLGLVKGHNRNDGWAALLELIAAQQSEQQTVDKPIYVYGRDHEENKSNRRVTAPQAEEDDMKDTELIEKLKANVVYHIRPYNLGDNGETEPLIVELIRRYEAAKQKEPEVVWTCPECKHGTSTKYRVCENCHFEIDEATHKRYLKDASAYRDARTKTYSQGVSQ